MEGIEFYADSERHVAPVLALLTDRVMALFTELVKRFPMDEDRPGND